ncbi:MAG: dTDP-4-dehydrorhamnose 3,5-epimerase [Candidatus Pacebacteria bacterium]|nr:dTDP-4-dehydrorhamnose 3,5-epimerase [Candidatus Paceibacterota bacterium]
MKVNKTDIEEVLIISPDMFGDERGYFIESFNTKRYKEFGIPAFVQEGESKSVQGVLRGLHYQLSPYAQGKLVRVVSGKVLDVAVDIRLGSKTYGKYTSHVLSGENKQQLWIPAGFAHGFLTLSSEAIFSYACMQYYNKESERSIVWNDKDLNIKWGIKNPILSAKDTVGVAMTFKEAEKEIKNS